MSETTVRHDELLRVLPSDAAPLPGDAEVINQKVVYTGWTVFAACSVAGAVLRAPLSGEDVRGLASAVPAGVEVRGWYDVSTFRADADVMVWWHSDDPRHLQAAQRAVLAAPGGHVLTPAWSTVGLHRPAEFNRAHVPAFLAGEAPRGYVCVYPFVRSYDWYLLPAAERAELLREHGAAARPYPDVRANTVSAFGLGDYEWLLAFEADELHRIVDLLRDLRATGARRHVRVEVPFFTGPRIDLEPAPAEGGEA